jgi:hypothetical protein
VEKSITFSLYNPVSPLRGVPAVNWVVVLKVTFFRGEVPPRTVSLLTVIRSRALLVVGMAHSPGGVRAL